MNIVRKWKCLIKLATKLKLHLNVVETTTYYTSKGNAATVYR